MVLSLAEEKARSLMNLHGQHEWRLEFDRACERAGLCDFTRKTISLSRHFVELNLVDDVVNTILHEIAHALVGSGSIS